MTQETRRTLRAAAGQAVWSSGPVRGRSAAATAGMLRELGSQLEARLAEVPRDFWAHRALAELAAHCRRASADWEQDIAQLSALDRLRDAAVISLAPPPGESDPAPSRPATTRDRIQQRSGSGGLVTRVPARWRTGRAAVLAVAGCLIVVVLAVVDFIAPHSSHPSKSPAPAGLASAPVASASVPAGSGTGGSDTGGSSTGGSSDSSSAPVPTSAPSSASIRTAAVTGLQVTVTPASDYPEVQVYGTVTASGTGQITVTVTLAGPGAATQSTSETESGRDSYAISHTLYLNPWCGHGPVTVTVTAGADSKSTTVPVSGC